jgi:hypothetical protein
VIPKTRRRKKAKAQKAVVKFAEVRQTISEELNEQEQALLLLISQVGIERTLQIMAKEFSHGKLEIQNQARIDHLTKRIEYLEEKTVRTPTSSNRVIQPHLFKDRDENLERLSDFDLWAGVLSIIKQKISKPSFDTWFVKTTAKYLDDDAIIVLSKNEFQSDWLENRYKDEIFHAVKEITERTYEIEFDGTS